MLSKGLTHDSLHMSIARNLLPSICLIFQLICEAGYFSAILKKSYLLPLLKSSDGVMSDVIHFRPIDIDLTLAKVL